MWKINSHHVVFDFNKDATSNCFCFKLNYAKKYAAWPKSYVLSFDNNSPEVRIIVPVISFKKCGHILLKKLEWYDMPLDVHEQILKIVNNKMVKRKLSWGEKTINLFLPKKYKYKEDVKIEDFVYVVTKIDNEYLVKAV